jgi:probable F420-dependent oxidoreductase
MVALGLTIPFGTVPLAEQRSWVSEAVELGFTELWSSEAGGADAFVPLALSAAWVPRARLGTAIVPVSTRGPGLLAMSIATLAEAAPGRVAIGLGASSRVVVEDWNGMVYHQPTERVRDTVRFLRLALAGERVSGQWAGFCVERFRLERVPEVVPPLLLAALRPRMLRLAAEVADGVILNWLAADDVPRALAAYGGHGEVVARIFVCPTEDSDAARQVGRRLIAAYLNVPAYAEMHRWLGRGPALEHMWAAWSAGDRQGALEAIPDDVVDALIVHGDPARCGSEVQRYVDAGVTTPVLAVLSAPGLDERRAMLSLAPHSA